MSNKFVFLRGSRNETPVGCVAFSTSGTTLKYQLSVVNPGKSGQKGGDKFDRVLGRSIAAARLVKAPISIEVENLETLNHWEVLVVLMSQLSANKTVPTRAIKAATAWLSNSAQLS